MSSENVQKSFNVESAENFAELDQNNKTIVTTADNNSLTKINETHQISSGVPPVSSSTNVDRPLKNVLLIKPKKSPGKFKHLKVQSQAAKQRDLGIKNSKLFAEYVDYCRKTCLRSILTKTEHDYEQVLTLDHSYNGKKSADNSFKVQNKQFYRELFVTRYNNLNPNQNEVLNSGMDLDVLTDNSLPQTNSTYETKEILDTFAQEAEIYAVKLKSVFEKSSETDNEPKTFSNADLSLEEILKESTPVNLRKPVEKIFKILLDEILVKRAVHKRGDQLNVRENHRQKNASRLRLIFSSIISDRRSIESIHKLLIKNLSAELLSVYISLLKVLKSKVPDLVLRICDGQIIQDDETMKRIFEILKEYFDLKINNPLNNVINFKTPSLARNPLFVLISPHVKVYGHVYHVVDRCHHFYKNLLPQLGKCFDIKFPPLKKDSTFVEVNQKLFSIVTEKLIEVKIANPTRHIVLVGWDTSCYIALALALEFPVAACVCFSFPNVTLNGIRGDVDDDILDVGCPVLFVVGQFASTCSLDDLLDTKDHMKNEKVGVILVGGANNDLKVCQNKLNSENITQKIVEKCIMDNVGEFLNDVLVGLPDVPPPPPRMVALEEQRRLVDVYDNQQPDSKRRCVGEKTTTDAQLCIKIPTLEAEATTSSSLSSAGKQQFLQQHVVKEMMSPTFKQPLATAEAPVVSSSLEHGKVPQQHRQRSMSLVTTTGTSLYLNVENPLGAYAAMQHHHSQHQQLQQSLVVPGESDGAASVAMDDTESPSTRTRHIKKRQILDL